MIRSFYETSDIYLAAYLLTRGATLSRWQRVALRRNKFIFESDEKLHHELRLYWMYGPIRLVPAKLFGSLRRLKSLVRLPPGDIDQLNDGDSGSNTSSRVDDGEESSVNDSPTAACRA